MPKAVKGDETFPLVFHRHLELEVGTLLEGVDGGERCNSAIVAPDERK